MNENECPVCDGRGYFECDDGAETQCEACEGTGQAQIAEEELIEA